MTCIVGVEHQGEVWIGGDSAAIGGYELMIRNDEKVFIRDGMLFGCAGSIRMRQLLRYALDIPEHSQKKDSMSYLVTDFVDSVRGCFEQRGWPGKHDDVGREVSGSWLLGYRGELLLIDSDFQIGRSSCGYYAVGCGADIALGSLHSTRQSDDPERRVRDALEAAECHSAGVAGPFIVLHGAKKERGVA